jgi:hypothetical protein
MTQKCIFQFIRLKSQENDDQLILRADAADITHEDLYEFNELLAKMTRSRCSKSSKDCNIILMEDTKSFITRSPCSSPRVEINEGLYKDITIEQKLTAMSHEFCHIVYCRWQCLVRFVIVCILAVIPLFYYLSTNSGSASLIDMNLYIAIVWTVIMGLIGYLIANYCCEFEADYVGIYAVMGHKPKDKAAITKKRAIDDFEIVLKKALKDIKYIDKLRNICTHPCVGCRLLLLKWMIIQIE